MDTKHTALLVDLHARITAGEFQEIDVLSLLALLREDAPKNGVLRELGDFVAHRNRNKGPVHRYLSELKAILDRLGTRDEVLRVAIVFTETDISHALDIALASHGLAALLTQRHRQVQLAILSMLQGVALSVGGKQFGVLELAVTPSEFQLAGVVTLAKPAGVRVAFPALTVVNGCYSMLATHGQVRPDGLIKVAVQRGVTVLEGVKPYQVHIGRKRQSGGAEPAKITWAEVQSALGGLSISAIRHDAAELDIPASDHLPVTFRLNDGRISFPGRPEHFLPESPVWQCALTLKHRLGARVYGDCGGYLFETPESLGTL